MTQDDPVLQVGLAPKQVSDRRVVAVLHLSLNCSELGVETVELAPRYDVRARETRVRAWSDAMTLFRFARSARGRSVRAGRA